MATPVEDRICDSYPKALVSKLCLEQCSSIDIETSLVQNQTPRGPSSSSHGAPHVTQGWPVRSLRGDPSCHSGVTRLSHSSGHNPWPDFWLFIFFTLRVWSISSSYLPYLQICPDEAWIEKVLLQITCQGWSQNSSPNLILQSSSSALPIMGKNGCGEVWTVCRGCYHEKGTLGCQTQRLESDCAGLSILGWSVWILFHKSWRHFMFWG